MNSFLRGLGSILSITPQRDPRINRILRRTDAEAIESDWRKIITWPTTPPKIPANTSNESKTSST